MAHETKKKQITIEVMLIVFFNNEELIRREFVPNR